MRSAATLISTSWDTCHNVRKLTEGEAQGARERASRWAEKLATSKKTVAVLLGAEEIPLPVKETVVDGVRTMSICEVDTQDSRTDLPPVASGTR